MSFPRKEVFLGKHRKRLLRAISLQYPTAEDLARRRLVDPGFFFDSHSRKPTHPEYPEALIGAALVLIIEIWGEKRKPKFGAAEQKILNKIFEHVKKAESEKKSD